jgi:uncharacterized phage-like protein YoqJ
MNGLTWNRKSLNKREEQKRLHRCAFTGHRPEKLNRSESEVKAGLKDAIEQSIADGFLVFFSGMARGVDLWAAEIVLEEKQRNRNIQLVCVIPYEGFERRWSVNWQNLYHSVLNRADFVRFVGEQYSPNIFQRRNEWMVDHTTRLIAVYNGTPGGTRNTIEYARAKNVRIVCLK